MPELSTLTRAQGANRSLIAGGVQPLGHNLVFAHEPVLSTGFRKMVRSLEYDVAEMALTTYLTAREHGVAFTALPIFLVRDFHYGATQILRGGPITSPADLTGGRVGVNRGYTVTTGVWGRAALAEAGLDLDSVTWVLSGDEHVATYLPPGNVVPAPAERSLKDLLLGGELDAVVGAAIDHPEVVPVCHDAEAAAMAMLRDRGIFPINHLVVVKDEVLAQCPGVDATLFDAFTEAKRRYVAELQRGELESRQDHLLAQVLSVTGSDPLPYGIEPNRPALEELLDQAVRQHILSRPVDLDLVFTPGTRELQG